MNYLRALMESRQQTNDEELTERQHSETWFEGLSGINP